MQVVGAHTQREKDEYLHVAAFAGEDDDQQADGVEATERDQPRFEPIDLRRGRRGEFVERVWLDLPYAGIPSSC